MIEVADKFNMVDMGGIDVLKAQGIVVDGLFIRLLNSIQRCKYSLLYNWYFAEIPIVPSPVELLFDSEKVAINDLITVTSDDIVHIYSIEKPAEPVLINLSVTENGIFVPPERVDGFDRVAVETPVVNPNIVPFDVSGETYLSVNSGTLRWVTTKSNRVFAAVLDPGRYIFVRDVAVSFTMLRYNSSELMNRMSEVIEKALTPAEENTDLFYLGGSSSFGDVSHDFSISSRTGVLFFNNSTHTVDPIIYKIQ